MTSTDSTDERCLTCHGTGETVTGGAPEVCPDCFGEGKLRRGDAKLEWRLRALERTYAARGDAETRTDIVWLVNELRRSHDALVRILSRCQDAPSDPVARDVARDAIDALGMYAPS
jgi:hypothetical protein